MKQLTPWLIVITSFIGLILQVIFCWSKLPDEVASHFGVGGQPNGWMSKTSFVVFAILMQTGMAFVMWGLGRLIRVLPTSMINIPNRQYWLAGDRRVQTLTETESMLAWVAAGTSVFMLVVMYFVFDANVGPQQKLNSLATWIAVSVYLMWLGLLCVVKLRKYYRVPAA